MNTEKLPIRLTDPSGRQHLLVDQDKVYQSQGSGKISIQDEVHGALAQQAHSAADYFENYYHVPYPGLPAQTPGNWLADGQLSTQEVQAFRAGQPIAAALNPLESHLKYFDANRDGKIDLPENYRGWRALGSSPVTAATQAAASSLVFGTLWDGFKINIAQIQPKRPHNSSGIYDASGRVNRALLNQITSAIQAEANSVGQISVKRASELIQKMVPELGIIPQQQFYSLKFIHNRGYVTATDVEQLFEGSLLYVAASKANRDGRRGLESMLPSYQPTRVESTILGLQSIPGWLSSTLWDRNGLPAEETAPAADQDT